MSTTARRYWLKALRRLGVRSFRATSGLGLPYVCHVGDFAGEVPFYNAEHSAAEILLMASWCRGMPAPIIFDVGANNGFVSTQLAQLLKDEQPQIYAFEPVPSTFCQLVDSIERLRLDQSVTPICCALSDEAGICTIAYNPRESLFAQVRSDTNNVRAGNRIAIAPIITIDDLVSGMSKMPVLIKIDVEGSEPSVFRGAMRLLRSDEAPVLCFEWNPFTIGELNKASDQMTDALKNYQLFYIDDFEGQKRPFGAAVDDLTTINLVCNIFAVPKNASGQRWTQTLDYAFRRLTLSR